jgi:prevent-host-death family protein
MSAKTVGAAEFKADCLKLIDQMSHDRQPVTVTKRGRPVATLSPITAHASASIIGALRGSVLRFDDPLTPALDAEAWTAGS